MFEAYKRVADKSEKHKSTTLLYAFVLSFLLLSAYVLAYVLVARITQGSRVQDVGSLLDVWVLPVGIGTIVSLLACVPMRFMNKKNIVPLAMALLAFYYLAVLIAILCSKTIQYPLQDAYILSFYLLPCIVPGNLLSWLYYKRQTKKQAAESRQGD